MIGKREIPIRATIQIVATYEDEIRIVIRDTDASSDIIHLSLTREQFINAAMNRLSNTPVESAVVYNPERIGKKMIVETLDIGVPTDFTRDQIITRIHTMCKHEPYVGWEPDLHLSSQGSIRMVDGIKRARTLMRRWVDK